MNNGDESSWWVAGESRPAHDSGDVCYLFPREAVLAHGVDALVDGVGHGHQHVDVGLRRHGLQEGAHDEVEQGLDH